MRPKGEELGMRWEVFPPLTLHCRPPLLSEPEQKKNLIVSSPRSAKTISSSPAEA